MKRGEEAAGRSQERPQIRHEGQAQGQVGQGLVRDEPAGFDQGGQSLVHPEGQRLPAQLQRCFVLPQPPAESPGQDGSGELRRSGLAVCGLGGIIGIRAEPG